MTTFRIGTRGSELALWQAHEVARLLGAAGHDSTIVVVKTTGDKRQGDKRQDVPLASIGGKGLFVKELEEALDRDEIDIAVHSLKDVPSIIPERFVLEAYLKRADARDIWIGREGRRLADLQPGSVVGTSSPRRRAQLLARFPGITVEAIRGNLDTRINKARSGVVDGVVLACAGLERLGRLDVVTDYFGIDEMVPAAGQGIIAIEARAEAIRTRSALARINHLETELLARCERGVLEHFGEAIGCDSAIAVHATFTDGLLTVRAVAFDDERDLSILVRQSGHDSRTLVRSVYDELIGKGAMELLVAKTTA
jgi:hydroxymethylbilane synthase